ncbi:hypothetical protein [Rufibacter aurantiacus]|uniref:hypothetical protein n=1 Tax=Rufibacter aurantiacus TaxID=2817374 RepID=UPI001B30D722|nr:hypothetical protein [Rufibacter aurantiacus]
MPIIRPYNGTYKGKLTTYTYSTIQPLDVLAQLFEEAEIDMTLYGLNLEFEFNKRKFEVDLKNYIRLQPNVEDEDIFNDFNISLIKIKENENEKNRCIVTAMIRENRGLNHTHYQIVGKIPYISGMQTFELPE